MRTAQKVGRLPLNSQEPGHEERVQDPETWRGPLCLGEGVKGVGAEGKRCQREGDRSEVLREEEGG